MCIILAKKKGVEIPSEDIIKTCFRNNPDGAGFMYQVGDYVKIEKGFMTVENLLKRLHTLENKIDLKNKSLVIHFRIGTSGKNDKKTTHPFPVSNNEKELTMLSLKSDIGMVHNGVIFDYVYKNDFSDTQNFVKDFVSVFKDLNKNFLENENVLALLKKECTSKLCFLDSNDNLYFVGDFIEDIETGLMFSNSTYKEYKRAYTYYNYDYNDSYYKGTTYTKEDYDTWEHLLEEQTSYSKDLIMSYEDLMLLNEDNFIQYENGNFEKCNNCWLAIDKNNTLYEVIDFFGDYDYIVDRKAKNVEIYNEDYEIIDFVGGEFVY